MPALRNTAARHGYTVVEESQIGGVNELTDKARAYDVLLITALGELAEDVYDTLTALEKLEGVGITILSLREPWVASKEINDLFSLPGLGNMRRLLLSIAVSLFQIEKEEAAAQAQWERSERSKKTKVALKQASAEGKAIGRPALTDAVDLSFVEATLKRGLSWPAIARVHPRTIRTARGGSRRPSSRTIRMAWEKAVGGQSAAVDGP